MTVTAVRYPVAPTVTPLEGTLLDAIDNGQDGIAWQDGLDLFLSYNCMSFGAEADFCTTNSKDLTQAAGWQNGFRFAAYGGVTCRAVGLDQGHMQAEVQRVFNSGESTAIERALMEVRFRADTEIDARWDAPVDITPVAGAVDPRVGIALLEGYAASEYVGVPTIHTPRTIAGLLAGLGSIVKDGSRFLTKTGAKVAAGGGYDYPNYGPGGLAAPVGEKWLYVTGEVMVLRGDAVIQQATDMLNNDVVVLAERPYIAAVDCFTAAVRVQVTV